MLILSDKDYDTASIIVTEYGKYCLQDTDTLTKKIVSRDEIYTLLRRGLDVSNVTKINDIDSTLMIKTPFYDGFYCEIGGRAYITCVHSVFHLYTGGVYFILPVKTYYASCIEFCGSGGFKLRNLSLIGEYGTMPKVSLSFTYERQTEWFGVYGRMYTGVHCNKQEYLRMVAML